MIYNSSNDPIYIKKISLRVWSLRDEVETIVKSKVAVNGPDQVFTEINEIAEHYTSQNPHSLKLLKGGEANPDEASPPEETSTPEESPEATTTSEEANEASTEVQANADNEPSDDTDTDELKINTQRPNLPAEKIYSGKTLLSEVGMDKIHFFSDQQFLEGQSIVLEFQIPKRFIVNADIVFCRAYSMKSRIISANKMPYRVSARFTFLKPGERALLRDFLESIEVDMTKIQPKELPKESEGSGDVSDDLGDFGDLGI